jgi:hypothetical protein
VAAAHPNDDGRVDLVATNVYFNSGDAPSTVGVLLNNSRPVASASTVTVSSRAGMPTGAITSLVGSRAVARVMLDADGQARLTRVFPRRGLFLVRAVYSGDVRFSASSQSLTERVNG